MKAALAKIRRSMRTSGLQQIENSLQGIERQLISSPLNVLEVLVLQGRCRELRVAQWFVNRIYPQDLVINPNSSKQNLTKPKKNYSSLWARLHASTLESLGKSLENQTPTPLEIDILREDKKRELLITVLQEFELLLAELQNSKLDSVQLLDKMPVILSDLWRSATTKFLGKYSILNYEGQDIELVNVLLGDQKIVEVAILNKIPFGFDLFSYLLFKTSLLINNTVYDAQTPEAIAHAEIILNNILIQVANAVMQPLLNNFADVEEIKQKFYSYHLIATREVERFRNNLSWHYRLESYWGEAQAIYESHYHLFTFTSSGIKKLDVYAHRRQELIKLSGIQFLVTLLLEIYDAIAPRIRAITALIGSGFVYVLKNILGKGIGLIGKGILQGIGDSFSVGRERRRSDRL
jgi:hypothetical protein